MKELQPLKQEIQKIFSGSIIVFVGMVINSGAQYLLILIIGKILGPAQVGLFFLGHTIMKFANIVSTLGLTGSLLKFIPDFMSKNQYNQVHTIKSFSLLTSFVLSSLIALILYLSAPFLSIHLFGDGNLILVIQLFSICLPFFTILTMIAAMLRSFRDMIAFALVEKVMLPGGLILFTFLTLNLYENIHTVIYSFFVSILAAIFLGILLLKRNLPEKKTGNQSINKKKILGFSIPFMGADFFGLGLLWMDSFMLGILMNTEAVGVYNGAVKIALFSEVAVSSVNSIYGPTISKFYSEGNLSGIESSYKTTVQWLIHLTLPFFLIVFLFPEQIMGIYGPEFVEGSTALVILAIGQMVNLSVGTSGSLLNMTGKPKVEFFNRAFVLLLNFTLNLHFIPLMGINGAATATALSTSTINLLRLAENYRFLNIHPFSIGIIWPFFKK